MQQKVLYEVIDSFGYLILFIVIYYDKCIRSLGVGVNHVNKRIQTKVPETFKWKFFLVLATGW